MANEPRWLEALEVVELNAQIVSDTSEPFALRDPGLLESALFNPRHRYQYDQEHDVVALAAALMMAVARNHPFMQGNKRTAFLAAVIFLELNGYELDIPDSELVAEQMIREIAGDEPLISFEEILRRCIV